MNPTEPRAPTAAWSAASADSPAPVWKAAQATSTHGAAAPESRRIDVLVGLAMAAVWGLFAYRHLSAFGTTREWLYLVICTSETLTAAFFLVRTAPVSVSTRPLDWFFAFGGTCAPLFFAPDASALVPAAKLLSYIGMCLQIVSLVSLNRSFALVAAKREIKTGGMYRVVRHPLYASYWLIFTGYVLTNTSWANLCVYLLTMGLLSVRAVREEAHLCSDAAYRLYMQQVRYRIVPGIF